MVEILHRSVGIIRRNHAEHINTFIKVSMDEESKYNSNSDVQPTPKKSLTFYVEGNISVWKTTFLRRIANETLELQDPVKVVPKLIKTGKMLDLITLTYWFISL
ncbi:hypothetical protein LOK49_LG08G01810 [Camellia lanceoleosa]|uniref:Uncharacterized protein n=1 Tax=Camellia lanceoleosa TaxID=1840588 RepID=A0ACC0GSH2_9ERIC|nr:hypothetical protein LOK49_LG08G01810 [Camellia lanceoleosa]